MAVKGCIRIETRLTEGDENGIYRITEIKQGYLMLAFEEQDEARVAAKVIAKALGVPYKDHLYTEPCNTGVVSGHIGGSEPAPLPVMIDVSVPEGAVCNKPKRVMGAVNKCKELIASGKVASDVESDIMQLYLDAGHGENAARSFARSAIKIASE